jgi:hypothetical protein
VSDVSRLTAGLVDLSGRLLRFEPVTDEELAAFGERRDDVSGRALSGKEG